MRLSPFFPLSLRPLFISILYVLLRYAHAMMTEFALLVVNNWFLILDGMKEPTSPYSVIYFVLFYYFAVQVMPLYVSNMYTQYLYVWKR